MGQRKAGGGTSSFRVLVSDWALNANQTLRGGLVVAKSNQIQIQIFSSPDTCRGQEGHMDNKVEDDMGALATGGRHHGHPGRQGTNRLASASGRGFGPPN